MLCDVMFMLYMYVTTSCSTLDHYIVVRYEAMAKT